jgi:opacity protein-like surface antigen
MKSGFSLTSAAVAALLCSCPSFASEWYFSLEPGRSKADLSDYKILVDNATERPDLRKTRDDDLALGFTVGRRFWGFLGTEMGFSDFGDYELSTSLNNGFVEFSSDASGVLAGLDLRSPEWRSFALFAKAGVFKWDIKAESRVRQGNTETVTSLDDQGTDRYYGVGLAYRVSRVGYIDFSYRKFSLGDALDIDLFSVGLAVAY